VCALNTYNVSYDLMCSSVDYIQRFVRCCMQIDGVRVAMRGLTRNCIHIPTVGWISYVYLTPYRQRYVVDCFADGR